MNIVYKNNKDLRSQKLTGLYQVIRSKFTNLFQNLLKKRFFMWWLILSKWMDNKVSIFSIKKCIFLFNNVKLKISNFQNIISPPFNFNNIDSIFENELDTIGTRFRKVAEKIIFDIYEKKSGQ